MKIQRGGKRVGSKLVNPAFRTQDDNNRHLPVHKEVDSVGTRVGFKSILLFTRLSSHQKMLAGSSQFISIPLSAFRTGHCTRSKQHEKPRRLRAVDGSVLLSMCGRPGTIFSSQVWKSSESPCSPIFLRPSTCLTSGQRLMICNSYA